MSNVYKTNQYWSDRLWRGKTFQLKQTLDAPLSETAWPEGQLFKTLWFATGKAKYQTWNYLPLTWCAQKTIEIIFLRDIIILDLRFYINGVVPNTMFIFWVSFYILYWKKGVILWLGWRNNKQTVISINKHWLKIWL